MAKVPAERYASARALLDDLAIRQLGCTVTQPAATPGAQH
jgi:hypothetical protein